jgi:hypothetical protein
METIYKDNALWHAKAVARTNVAYFIFFLIKKGVRAKLTWWPLASITPSGLVLRSTTTIEIMDFSFMATSFLSSSFVQAKVINNATFYYH